MSIEPKNNPDFEPVPARYPGLWVVARHTPASAQGGDGKTRAPAGTAEPPLVERVKGVPVLNRNVQDYYGELDEFTHHEYTL